MWVHILMVKVCNNSSQFPYLIFELKFELQQFKLLHIMAMRLCLANSTQNVCNVQNNEWMASPWWVFTSILTKIMSFDTNIMNGVYKWWTLSKNHSLFNFFIGPSTHFTLRPIPILGWIFKPYCWIIFGTNCRNPTLGLSVRMQFTLPKVGKMSPPGLSKT
jgi:hypothetical protein